MTLSDSRSGCASKWVFSEPIRNTRIPESRILAVEGAYQLQLSDLGTSCSRTCKWYQATSALYETAVNN